MAWSASGTVPAMFGIRGWIVSVASIGHTSVNGRVIPI
jgi:hypothetical protein